MSDILREKSIEMLQEQQINPNKIGNIYYGNGSYTLPTLLDDGIYYFKFFPTRDISEVQSEVDFVDYLINRGISIPRLLNQNSREVFQSHDSSTVFYASEHMDGDYNPVLSRPLIEEIITNIAQMHSMAKDFDKSSVTMQKRTDYQRLIDLYIKTQCDRDQRGIAKCIERTMKIGVQDVPTYPIHSDLYMGNIVTKDGKFRGFFDFSNLRESYLEDDLGKFFQSALEANAISPKDIDSLVKLYEKESGISLNRDNLYVSTLYCVLERYYKRGLSGYSEERFPDTIQNLLKLGDDLQK